MSNLIDGAVLLLVVFLLFLFWLKFLSPRATKRREIRRNIVQRYKAIKAMGGTLEQIQILFERTKQHQFEEETKYITGRALVLARDAYYVGIRASERSVLLGKFTLLLPFGSALISLASSGFVPPEQQGIALLLLGIFSGGDTLLRGYISMVQPSLEWLAARRTYRTITREVALRLSLTEDYGALKDDAQRFLLLQARCEEVIGQNEDDLLKQIKANLTVTTDDSGAGVNIPKEDEEDEGSF